MNLSNADIFYHAILFIYLGRIIATFNYLFDLTFLITLQITFKRLSLNLILDIKSKSNQTKSETFSNESHL